MSQNTGLELEWTTVCWCLPLRGCLMKDFYQVVPWSLCCFWRFGHTRQRRLGYLGLANIDFYPLPILWRCICSGIKWNHRNNWKKRWTEPEDHTLYYKAFPPAIWHVVLPNLAASTAHSSSPPRPWGSCCSRKGLVSKIGIYYYYLSVLCSHLGHNKKKQSSHLSLEKEMDSVLVLEAQHERPAGIRHAALF